MALAISSMQRFADEFPGLVSAKPLGGGTFAKVLRTARQSDGLTVAVKVPLGWRSRHGFSERLAGITEAKLLWTSRNLPHVVKMLGAFHQPQGPPAIVMELADMTMLEYLRNRSGRGVGP